MKAVLFCVVVLFALALAAPDIEAALGRLVKPSFSHKKAWSSLSNTPHRIMRREDSLTQKLMARHKGGAHLQEMSQACYNALVPFIAVAEECGPQIEKQFDYNNVLGRTEEQIVADTVLYCEGGCAANFTELIGNIADSCTAEEVGEDEQWESDIRQLLSLVQIPCVSLDGTYCAPAMYAVALADDGSDEVTQEEVDANCVPCVTAMFKAFATFATDAEALMGALFLNLICIKDSDDNFCFVESQGVFDDDGNDADFLEDLAAMCQPCVRSIVAGYYNIALLFGPGCYELTFDECNDDICVWNEQDGCVPSLDVAVIDTLNTLCGRNTEDELCLPLFFNLVSSFETDPPEGVNLGACPDDAVVETPPETCEQGCIDTIAYIESEMGCCAAYVPEYFVLDGEEGSQAWADFFVQQCGLEDAAECPLPFLEGTFTILNLKWSFVDQNGELIEATLKNDIALASGVASADVVVTLTEADSGAGVVVEYSVTAESNADADQISAKLSVDLSFPTLNSDPEVPLTTAREDFTAALTADPTSVSALSITYAEYTPPADDDTTTDDGTPADGEDDEVNGDSAAAGLAASFLCVLPAALLAMLNW